MTEVVTENTVHGNFALKPNDSLNSRGFIVNEKIWMESGLASNFREEFRSQVFDAPFKATEVFTGCRLKVS